MCDRSDKNCKVILKYLPEYIIPPIEKIFDRFGGSVNEIRLRVGRPAVVMLSDDHQTICPDRFLLQTEINAVYEKICDYSVYSHQAELAQGYITVQGGHRVGVCGTASSDKNGTRTIRYISSVNIRIASEHPGCSTMLMNQVFSDHVCGVLIAGPPCSGKTTLLKDIALKLSSRPYFKKVAMVDERNELAGMYRGVPQNTLGDFCDVLCGYPKAEGILNAVRALSPDIIICDEIGNKEDVEALLNVLNTGVTVISSVHACNVDELYRREMIKKLLNSGAFEKIVVLRGGSSRCVLDSVVEVEQK